MKKEIRIVDKEKGIVQITLPDERWYQRRQPADGTFLEQDDFYPSVTWITSYYPKGYGYEKWLADKGIDKAEEIKNEAGQKGSRVHKACGELMLGNEVRMEDKYANDDGELAELSAEEYGIVMSFRKFLDDEQPFILGVEYTLLNHEHKFGGTVDMKCRLKSDGYESIWILDIKTSKDIYPSHELQVSAYKETDEEVQRIGIIQVGYKRNKNGYKLTEIEPQFPLFLNVKGIWAKEQSMVQIPQREYPLSLHWEPVKMIPELKAEKLKKQK